MRIPSKYLRSVGILLIAASMLSLIEIPKIRRSGKEDLQQAKALIQDFLMDTLLNKIAKDCAFGGTFPKSLINFNNVDSGIVMWFCFHPLKRDFFLAIDQNVHPPADTFIKNPLARGQISPISLSKYEGTPREEDIESFLANDSTPQTIKEPSGVSQRSKKTTRRIKRFRRLFGNEFLEQLNQKTNYAFFQNNVDSGSTVGLLRQLHDQSDGSVIRYYIARDSEYSSNRLRVLLFSVDKDGKNVLYKKDSAGNILKDENGKAVSALILQRSIPPRDRR